MLQSELRYIKVKEVMTKHPIAVTKSTPLIEVKSIFEENRIHHIPVLDDEGYVVGIISKSDILMLLDWGTKLGLKGSEARNDLLFRSNTAADIQQLKPIIVREDDTLMYCVDIFRENYFRCLPVLDQAGKLIGIITPFDLMLAAFTEAKHL